MIDLNELVRKNIIIIMNQKKITTTFIISKTKGSNDSIYRYLRGTRTISLKICSFFANVLDVPIQKLFDEDNFYKFKDVFKLPYKNYNNKNNSNKSTDERNNSIYFFRKISPNKKTLQTLADEFNISRERVRQIESKLQEQHDKL